LPVPAAASGTNEPQDARRSVELAADRRVQDGLSATIKSFFLSYQRIALAEISGPAGSRSAAAIG
jgi:hypothetical protein